MPPLVFLAFAQHKKIVQLVDLPSALVGYGLSAEDNAGQHYRNLLWCLTPGERHCNLYPVVDLVAKVMVMAGHDLIPTAAPSVIADDDQDDGVAMRA